MNYEFKPVTLGECLSDIDTGGFILTETLHPPGLSIPSHIHEHANISFVLDGAFIETTGGHHYDCAATSLLSKPPGAVHKNQYGPDGARCLIIEVKPVRLNEIRHYSNILDGVVSLEEWDLSPLAMRVYEEFRIRDGVSSLSIEGLMFEVIAHIARRRDLGYPTSTRKPKWLCEAAEIINAQFQEGIALSELANTVGVHPSHLARVFRLHYRCSMGDYVRRLRLDLATRLLSDFDKSLSGVALEAGFFDQSHFSSTFKRHTGLTPTEYRSALSTYKGNTKPLRMSNS